MFTVSLTFATGSADGEEACAPVTAYSDNLVEFEEIFTIKLALLTPNGSFLDLGNAEAAINLIDSDCKWLDTPCVSVFKALALVVAALFELPAMTAVSENDSSLTICSTMTTIPQESTLTMEVVVFLFTLDGTGG